MAMEIKVLMSRREVLQEATSQDAGKKSVKTSSINDEKTNVSRKTNRNVPERARRRKGKDRGYGTEDDIRTEQTLSNHYQ